MIPTGNKCYLTYYTSLHQTGKLVGEYVDKMLMNAGIPDADYVIDENESSFTAYLYFETYNDDATSQHVYSDKLQELGFTEDGYENLNLVLSKMIGTQADHTMTEEGMIIELHGESEIIMDELNHLFENIDSMTADEAKIQVSLIHRRLKEKYGW